MDQRTIRASTLSTLCSDSERSSSESVQTNMLRASAALADVSQEPSHRNTTPAKRPPLVIGVAIVCSLRRTSITASCKQKQLKKPNTCMQRYMDVSGNTVLVDADLRLR